MDKKVAYSVLKNLDHELQEALREYLNERVSELLKVLEIASDIDEIRKLQGALRELRKLENIKDTARKVADARTDPTAKASYPTPR